MPAAHWAVEWLGPHPGDCAALVRDVQAAEFGREVRLPDGRPRGRRGLDAALAAGAAEQATPTDRPRDGDLALMRARGRRRSLGHHAGVYCDVRGEPYVLHWLAASGAATLLRVRRLGRAGLELTETLRWR